MCQWDFRRKHWKSVKIFDFGPSLLAESWFCSDLCLSLAWKHKLLRKFQSLSKHFAIASTFLHFSLSLPQLSLSQGLCTNVLLGQCLIKMSIILSLCALVQQNVNQFQVGQCLQLWTLETFTSEIILPCCLLLYYKQVLGINWANYTFTMNVCGLHLCCIL